MFELQAVKMITMDRQKADRMVKCNRFASQRKISWDWVNELVQRQKEGLFRTGEVALAQNSSGQHVLVNGQHQCLMVIKTGIPIPAKLEQWHYDTPADLSSLFRQFDAHRIRTQAQMVDVEAEQLGMTTPKQLNRLVVTAASINANIHKQSRAKINEKVKLLRDHAWFMPFVRTIFCAGGKKIINESHHLRRGIVVSVMIRTTKASTDQAEKFWTDVRDGTNLTKATPQWHLRNFLMTTNSGGKGNITSSKIASEKEFAARCIHAWNAFCQERKVRNLVYSADKPLPKVHGE